VDNYYFLVPEKMYGPTLAGQGEEFRLSPVPEAGKTKATATADLSLRFASFKMTGL
jgi:hypothetical protein